MIRPTRFPTALVLTMASVLAVAVPARAQSIESEPPPARGEYEPEPLPALSQPFLVPDMPQSVLDKVQINERFFTLKFGLSTVFDYTGFSQDDTSVAQVSGQESQWDIRDLRLMLRGTGGRHYKVSYFVAGVYKGFDSDPDTRWELVDVNLTFPLHGQATKLIVGKSKETFGYEMVGDSGNLAQQERVLSPFFVSRNIGIKVSQVMAAHRMTATFGVFNDWFATGMKHSDSGTDVTFRVTGLAWDRPDTNQFFHLAVAGRHVGADNETLRYKGRPESNVTDNYIDTGNLAADHAWHTGFEALWNRGPYSVLAEYSHASVDAPASGNPAFHGYYFTGSWVLTGETRRYDRTVGFARRVIPAERFGAPEIVARFSHVDLDDKAVSGGTFDKTYFGLNWWATRRWKFGTGWGRTSLDRFGQSGITNAWQTRIQWVY